jgi:hypothetical protein
MLEREAVVSDLEFFVEARGFLSPLDEEIFWEWMDRLGCKGEFVDEDRRLAIRLSQVPNQDHLWMLISFFCRYNIDLRQLIRFETPQNSKWLRNPNHYWHAAMFQKE